MRYILAIDIGNTNITAGIFRGDRLIGKRKMPTHAYSLYGKNFKALLASCSLNESQVYDIIISSVVPIALSRLVMHLNKTPGRRVSIVGPGIKVPIKNLYRVRGEVGQDRLVNAYAARILYGAPCIIIDFGTAITFDIVSGKGEYLGGLILPGIEMSLKGLYEKTALLPRVELKEVRHIIGKDTAGSMRGGILFGFGAMCDGLVNSYRKILGKAAKVIATGGNADLVKRYAKSIRVIDEDLTLKGLFFIAPSFRKFFP